MDLRESFGFDSEGLSPIDLSVYSKNFKQKSLRMFRSYKYTTWGSLDYQLVSSGTLIKNIF